MALIIAKLYGGNDVFLSIVENLRLSDPFVCSMYLWLKCEYISSVDTLLDASNADWSKLFTFYRFLCHHPLYLKAKSIQSYEADQTHLKRERELFIRAAVSHLIAGCPIPALIVLNEVPIQKSVQILDVKTEIVPEVPNHNWGATETQDEKQARFFIDLFLKNNYFFTKKFLDNFTLFLYLFVVKTKS